MKKLFPLLFLLAACDHNIGPDDMASAVVACEANGGIDYLNVYADNEMAIYCKNSAKFYLRDL